MFKVTFTATVYNPDTEETFDGWVSPRWNMFTLYDSQADVASETFYSKSEAVRYIETTIGMTEHDPGKDDLYAMDSVMDDAGGESWHYAGHIEEV